MEGVLDTLMGIFGLAAATSVTEDNTVPAEHHLTSMPATVTQSSQQMIILLLQSWTVNQCKHQT